MLQSQQGHSLAPNSELATKLTALRPGGAVTIIGLGQAQLGEVLSGTLIGAPHAATGLRWRRHYGPCD